MSDSFANLVASLLGTGAQVAAMLIMTHFGSLAETADFTLSFALFAPLQLAAGMAFSQLLIAGDPAYSDPLHLILARLVTGVPIFAIVVLGALVLHDFGLFIISALIAISRLCDLVSDICQAQCRVESRYPFLLISRTALLVSFLVLTVVFLKRAALGTSLAVGLAFLIANLIGVGIDLYVIRRALDLRRPLYPSAAQLASTVRANLGRGLSNLLNSFSSNVPRYALHLVSPEIQAVYSLLIGLSRLGILLIQSLLYPTMTGLHGALVAGDRRRLAGYGMFLLMIAGCCSIPFLAGWVAAVRLGFVDNFNPQILRAVSEGEGLIVLLSTTAFFVRFGAWNLAMIGMSQRLQIGISLIGLGVMTGVCFLAVRLGGVVGAALSETGVNMIIVGLVFVAITMRLRRSLPEGGVSA